MNGKIKALALVGAVAVAGTAACDDTLTGSEDARMRVLLTDAPSDYIEAAYVDIGEVHLMGGDGEEERIILSLDGTDGLVNLLDLQGAATETLADTDIDPGFYTQLRLIVEDARVELKDGYEFEDGTTERDLFIPSGAQTGIKLNLAAADADSDGGGLEIRPGELVLVVDFDVSRSFVIQGNPETPAGIKGVLFTPTLRVTVNDAAASISGTVSTDLDVSVEGLTVTATPEDEEFFEEFQTQEATAITDADGDYTIHFLVPGTYQVTVQTADGYTTAPESVTVTVDDSENRDEVDFTVVES